MEDIDVKVILTIPRKKVEEDKKEIEHWNPGSMQNDEDIKQHYFEYFWVINTSIYAMLILK